jgi:hypothetical protein
MIMRTRSSRNQPKYFKVYGYAVNLSRKGRGFTVRFRDPYPFPAKMMLLEYLVEEGFF